MKVQDQTRVAIDYRVYLGSGKLLNQSEPGRPFEFVFRDGRILTSIEDHIEGMEEGESTVIMLEPKDAYGERDPNLLKKIPKHILSNDADLSPGATIDIKERNGYSSGRVEAVDDATVTVDFNHPLAGEHLRFDVTIAEVRSVGQGGIITELLKNE